MTQIKSRAAADLIKRSYFRTDYSKDWDKDPTLRKDYIAKPNAITAVIIAETEAHDRAVEIFSKTCPQYNNCSQRGGSDCYCQAYKKFVNELNK